MSKSYKVLVGEGPEPDARESSSVVLAEFSSLSDAVNYCREQADHQLALKLHEVANGIITTPREIDDAITQLVSAGRNWRVSNIYDPAAREAFDLRTYARGILTAAVMRREKQPFPSFWYRMGEQKE